MVGQTRLDVAELLAEAGPVLEDARVRHHVCHGGQAGQIAERGLGDLAARIALAILERGSRGVRVLVRVLQQVVDHLARRTRVHGDRVTADGRATACCLGRVLAGRGLARVGCGFGLALGFLVSRAPLSLRQLLDSFGELRQRLLVLLEQFGPLVLLLVLLLLGRDCHVVGQGLCLRRRTGVEPADRSREDDVIAERLDHIGILGEFLRGVLDGLRLVCDARGQLASVGHLGDELGLLADLQDSEAHLWRV